MGCHRGGGCNGKAFRDRERLLYLKRQLMGGYPRRSPRYPKPGIGWMIPGRIDPWWQHQTLPF
ncbi:hypothetical protein [Laspinema olomoucense]|uniref:Uncharacterized protein n=1 Tax=Laspinema olomoucense D3b TaxID=2953688 RepID=A0ABT2N7P9_9CYAN|nr:MULTISPECIES: hypothetical protein [unclassified Laspinema]MCT7973185.1 hypothetical protein [Laspinema sp. D3d]MCT7978728.1 hypothetical protein [Laspinema sp. D3b]MCT7990865.1 hypothetical protein [Laspinema sp. D3a]MCT7993206.1 hypothetical protein [Laspinema sp. D3c]